LYHPRTKAQDGTTTKNGVVWKKYLWVCRIYPTGAQGNKNETKHGNSHDARLHLGYTKQAMAGTNSSLVRTEDCCGWLVGWSNWFVGRLGCVHRPFFISRCTTYLVSHTHHDPNLFIGDWRSTSMILLICRHRWPP
jgi:hypothetical protein